MAARSASGDVWVGGVNADHQALVACKQGSTWTALESPGITAVNQVLGVPTTDVWAAGYTFNATAGVMASVVAQWNGSAWSTVSGATPLSGALGASTVTAHIPGTDATWAVGGLLADQSGNVLPGEALIEYNPSAVPAASKAFGPRTAAWPAPGLSAIHSRS